MSSQILKTVATEPVPRTIELPAPTAWPIVLAFGFSLMFAGLVTDVSVSILGAIFTIAGCVGWFRDVLPHEKHESMPIEPREVVMATTRPEVARVNWMTQELNRARLPLEIYPISAGVKGGLAGGIAMAFFAVLYGIISRRGIWYPINLLSAGLFGRTSVSQIATFRWDELIVASIIHLVCSVLVGLLYGAMLPMFPRRPILLGGVVAPVLWSGVIHSVIEALDSVLNQRIDWLWFVVSQIGFGIVAGIVVSKQERIHTWQYLPFAVRAGIESPGSIGEKNDKKSGESHSQ
jgi:hypothetical protein